MKKSTAAKAAVINHSHPARSHCLQEPYGSETLPLSHTHTLHTTEQMNMTENICQRWKVKCVREREPGGWGGGCLRCLGITGTVCSWCHCHLLSATCMIWSSDDLIQQKKHTDTISRLFQNLLHQPWREANGAKIQERKPTILILSLKMKTEWKCFFSNFTQIISIQRLF